MQTRSRDFFREEEEEEEDDEEEEEEEEEEEKEEKEKHRQPNPFLPIAHAMLTCHKDLFFSLKDSGIVLLVG